MIEDCIQLKIQVHQGCGRPDLKWFKELCDIKVEIEEKKRMAKENPKDAEKK